MRTGSRYGKYSIVYIYIKSFYTFNIISPAIKSLLVKVSLSCHLAC